MFKKENLNRFFIGGKWIEPAGNARIDVINPSTEAPVASIAVGTAKDVDFAVRAARDAFPAFSERSTGERAGYLRQILEQYNLRRADVAAALSQEMGAPLKFALERQAAAGTRHLAYMISVLEKFEFERLEGPSLIRKEPIGVVGLITPWNWPIHQIVLKVAPAIAAGCTVVLKPSELSPLSAIIWTEVIEAAGLPAGVFNMVQGSGAEVGAAIAAHPDIDMVSFTGSTRAGKLVAQAAANTVKRVAQELGGKSANIILPTANLKDAIEKGVAAVMGNSGQSCDGPTRMLVPAAKHAEALKIAKNAVGSIVVGPVDDEATTIGPVANRSQFEKVQGLIQAGIDEGAELIAGGTGRPHGLESGFFVKPTIFGGVSESMRIAREEIFGPVLVILAYRDEEDAIRIANDTNYGLASYVQSSDLGAAQRVARKMRSGRVYINYPAGDPGAPFGGYKQSGNGRECGAWGLEEYLEVKGVLGFAPPQA
jgi:aldehyde dehydrogenase (NAD+)